MTITEVKTPITIPKKCPISDLARIKVIAVTMRPTRILVKMSTGQYLIKFFIYRLSLRDVEFHAPQLFMIRNLLISLVAGIPLTQSPKTSII